jgi:hypothetical protein
MTSPVQSRREKVTNATGLRNELAKQVPGNAEFEDEFRNARVSKDYLARYYLRQLERRVNPDLGGLVVSDSTADISLEHVLPENKTTDWNAFDDEMHASYVNRMGNLCLLAEDDNASLGSGSFAAKRKAYRTSSLALTKDIATNKAWTRKEIEDRSAKLASLAVKTWPLSVDMVKPAKSRTAKATSTK